MDPLQEYPDKCTRLLTIRKGKSEKAKMKKGEEEDEEENEEEEGKIKDNKNLH